ncbi:hypothetical protein DY000_02006379 [Brassica cretica]|uniref:Uncharacterized protein n=1 Tax=Brassica cretica TaxID=69181 RepID=A0ABQ7C3U5_BRACR|nr:hypothetical protein DY000_02006379 [Brassica cretica]
MMLQKLRENGFTEQFLNDFHGLISLVRRGTCVILSYTREDSIWIDGVSAVWRNQWDLYLLISTFEQAGFPTRLGMIIYAILQVVITALNAPIVDRAGRKPLLLVRRKIVFNRVRHYYDYN